MYPGAPRVYQVYRRYPGTSRVCASCTRVHRGYVPYVPVQSVSTYLCPTGLTLRNIYCPCRIVSAFIQKCVFLPYCSITANAYQVYINTCFFVSSVIRFFPFPAVFFRFWGRLPGACDRWSARSTGSASVLVTPPWKRSLWLCTSERYMYLRYISRPTYHIYTSKYSKGGFVPFPRAAVYRRLSCYYYGRPWLKGPNIVININSKND